MQVGLSGFFFILSLRLGISPSFINWVLINQIFIDHAITYHKKKMEFQAYPSPSSLPSPKSDATSSSRIWVERVREVSCDAVSAVIGNLFSAVFTFFFALVGSLLGAMTGALIGQGAESGIFRGTAVGAISGAVLSIKVFEYSLLIWDYDNSGFGCVLYLIDVIDSLLSGKLVQDRIAPAMISAIESQMDAGEPIFEEIPSIFEMGGTEGLSRDLVEKIPKIKITTMNYVDTSGESVSCSVCLQDFQLEETVRSLPHCHHMFHLPCIDEWLIRHGSCPLCRRDI